MTRKLSMLLVALCAFAFAVAGCGDDETDAGTSGQTTTDAPQTTTEPTGASVGNEEAAKAAREGCEAGIKGNAAIAADKQAELAKECEKVGEAAASGDKEEFRAAYTEYCDKLAEALPEAARDAAKDGCLQGADALG